MKRDDKTTEQKQAASKDGGKQSRERGTLDMAWDSVQAANRAAGPWGALEMWRVREAA